jgi:pentose-5-phosphate-3-epimerase
MVWAGSNVIVAGTSVFSAEKPADVISTLRKAVDDAIAERKQKQ